MITILSLRSEGAVRAPSTCGRDCTCVGSLPPPPSQDTTPITGVVPNPTESKDPQRRAAMERALAYMGLQDHIGQKLEDVAIDKVCRLSSCI